MKHLLFFSFIVLTALSCKKDRRLQYEKDDDAIQQYISDHGLSATKTESGLYVVISQQGSGSSCNANSTVTVKYKGYFTDGSVFDESSETGATFNLQNVISGWTEGIPYFKEGGEGMLLIPSRLGYGESGSSSGSIPPNSVLIFDVKLLDVQ